MELLAFVQLGKGLWGDLGADKMARAERLNIRYKELYLKAQQALEEGDPGAQGLITTAGNLKRTAERVTQEAVDAASGASGYLITGLVLLLTLRIFQGFYANLRYEKQYLSWRADPRIPSGFNLKWGFGGGLLWLLIVPLTLYRFTVSKPSEFILIPIIAFFGTGKPPGVLSTIIFGMPPVIRLTALGMRQVPDGTKEAAIAFGCNKWTLLRDVELPLAMPSIMTGINQTILMCLSMVVIASLIGAGGLGKIFLKPYNMLPRGKVCLRAWPFCFVQWS